MSSMDVDANMSVKSHYSHHHTMSAQNLSTYTSRTVPSYYGSEDSAAQESGLASPRYSPNVQPWRRQPAQSSLSFIPSTSPRPEHSEYTTSQQHHHHQQQPHPQQQQLPPLRTSLQPPRRGVPDRSSACISPFRSVRRMKQPFQLRLPASPSYDTHPSPASSRDSLRTPSGNHSLRTWRSDGNLMTTSLETFGLLPSPPLSDCRNSQLSPSSAYFSPKTESDSDTDQGTPKRNDTCIARLKPYDVPGMSTTEEQTETQTKTPGTTNVHMAHSHLIQQCEPSDNGKCTPVSLDSERVSSPPVSSDIACFGRRDFSGSSANTQRSRSGTASSEASWAASSLSYCEKWLQGAPTETIDEKGDHPRESNRRKFQIVQNSPPPAERKREKTSPDEPVMFASVASKSKPKLVDISRQSSPATSYSLPTPPQQPLPCTPDQRLQEISAFSPDTPLDIPDSGYATHPSCYSPDYRADKEDDSASSISSSSVNDPVAEKHPTASHIRPISMPKPSLRSHASPKTNPSHRHSSNPGSGREELKKWWDHEWTIDQLEQSVRDFPRNMLKLTSPAVMFLRQNNEKALIRPFRQIFPDVAENLLDSLCAALIARNYVVSLATMAVPNRLTSNFAHKPSLSRLDTVPEKACSTLGIHYPQTSPSSVKDRVLGSRSGDLRKELDRIVDNLIFAICGKQDETLKAAVLVLAQVLETHS